MRRAAAWTLVLALLACDETDSVDSVPDAGSGDLGVGPWEPYDGGQLEPRDVGPTTRADAGFADPSVVAQGRVLIGSTPLFVTVRGTLTSTMPPLIVLPTGPMHGQEYLYRPTEFLLGPGGVERPDRLIVYLDPRATGRSFFGALDDIGVTVETHVRDVENLIAYVDGLVPGGAGRVDFLGHGYGAALAVLYAAQHPDRISRLVLANPFPINVRDYANWRANFEARLDASEVERRQKIVGEWRVCLRDLRNCSEEYWRIIGPSWACPENRAVLERLGVEHIDLRPFQTYIDRDLKMEPGYDWAPILTWLPLVPTTVISGPCDPIPESSFGTYTASVAGATRVVIPGSGHFSLAEQPEAFQRAVRRALSYSEPSAE